MPTNNDFTCVYLKCSSQGKSAALTFCEHLGVRLLCSGQYIDLPQVAATTLQLVASCRNGLPFERMYFTIHIYMQWTRHTRIITNAHALYVCKRVKVGLCLLRTGVYYQQYVVSCQYIGNPFHMHAMLTAFLMYTQFSNCMQVYQHAAALSRTAATATCTSSLHTQR